MVFALPQINLMNEGLIYWPTSLNDWLTDWYKLYKLGQALWVRSKFGLWYAAVGVVKMLHTDNKPQIRKWMQSPSKRRSDVTQGAAAQPPFRCNTGLSEMNWQRIHSHNVFTNPSGLILQKQIYKICRQTQIKQRTVQKLRPPYPLWSVDCRGTRANI